MAQIVAPMLNLCLDKQRLVELSESERLELTDDVLACFGSVPDYEGPDRDLFRVAVKLRAKTEIEILQAAPTFFRDEIRKQVRAEDEYERTGSACISADPLKLSAATRAWLRSTAG